MGMGASEGDYTRTSGSCVLGLHLGQSKHIISLTHLSSPSIKISWLLGHYITPKIYAVPNFKRRTHNNISLHCIMANFPELFIYICIYDLSMYIFFQHK